MVYYKRHMMTVLMVIALILGGLQPTLIMFDFLQEPNTNLSHINFWHITLFGIDGSMMLLMVIPGIALWLSNRKFYETSLHVSSIEEMDQENYRTWIKHHLYHSYLIMFGAMVTCMLFIYLLPFFRPDALTAVGITSTNDVFAILWFASSSLLAGLAIVNVWMLVSRKRWLFPLSVLGTLFGVYIGSAVVFEVADVLFNDVDNLILESLVNMPIDRAYQYGITSYLVAPTMLFANLAFFWITFDLVYKRFPSKESHIQMIRQSIK